MKFLLISALFIFFIIANSSIVYAQEEHNVNDEFIKLLEGENKKSFLTNQKSGSFSGNFGIKEKLESHGNDILIKFGTNIEIERSQLLEYGTILIDGTLTIYETGDVPLRVQKIIVGSTGKLNIGTEQFPIDEKNNVEIIFIKNQPGEIGLFNFGELTIHGYDLGYTFSELTSDVFPEQETITVTQSVKKWNPQSKILITSPGNNVDFKRCLEENEIFRIEGSSITLKTPLKCFHQGFNGDDEIVSSNVVVLDRNIVIRSEDLENRGSVNFFHGSDGYVKFGEFRDLGPKNVLGRYPIHFHHMLDTSRGIEVEGNSIINSDNRWVTIHDSNGIIVKNNVGFKSIGHGFFLEEGTEFDNVFERNIGISTLRGNLISSDGKSSVFWTMNPRNLFKNNVAVDGSYYGFHFSIPNMLVNDPNSENEVNLQSLSNLEFDENVAYNNRHAGLVISRPLVTNESIENQTISISEFKVWTNLGKATNQWGVLVSGEDIVIKDSKIFDSPIGIQLSGSKNLVEDTSIKIINQADNVPLVSGILISGEDMTINQSLVQGYQANEISSPSDILIDNSVVQKKLISGFIIDTTLFDPQPIFFGNPVNSKSFLQIHGYDAPNGPKNLYPSNFILQKIDFENLSRDNQSVDFNFVAEIIPVDENNYNEDLNLSIDLEKSSKNNKFEKIQMFKNKAIAWDKNIISNNEFSTEIKVLIQEEIIKITMLDLDNLDSYDLNLPAWMKKTANFWIRNLISDQEIINSIEFVLERNLTQNLSSYG